MRNLRITTFYMKTNVLQDFFICISVPLIFQKFYLTETLQKIDCFFYFWDNLCKEQKQYVVYEVCTCGIELYWPFLIGILKDIWFSDKKYQVESCFCCLCLFAYLLICLVLCHVTIVLCYTRVLLSCCTRILHCCIRILSCFLALYSCCAGCLLLFLCCVMCRVVTRVVFLNKSCEKLNVCKLMILTGRNFNWVQELV